MKSCGVFKGLNRSIMDLSQKMTVRINPRLSRIQSRILSHLLSHLSSPLNQPIVELHKTYTQNDRAVYFGPVTESI